VLEEGVIEILAEISLEETIAAVVTLELPDKLAQMQDCEWPTRENDQAKIQVITEWLNQFDVGSQARDPSQQNLK
jgi:hypothetical protein